MAPRTLYLLWLYVGLPVGHFLALYAAFVVHPLCALGGLAWALFVVLQIARVRCRACGASVRLLRENDFSWGRRRVVVPHVCASCGARLDG